MRVDCACGHDFAMHGDEVPHRGATNALEALAMEFHKAAEELGREPTWRELEERELGLGTDLPCRALDCRCPAFVAAPLAPGTYIHTGLGEDGFEVLSHEPAGQARLCVFDRCEVQDGEERYRVILYPDAEGNDEDELGESEDPSWDEGYSEEELSDPEMHHAAPVRYVPSVSCIRCVVGRALVSGT